MVPKTKSSLGTVPVSRFQYKNQVKNRSSIKIKPRNDFRNKIKRLETVNYLYIEGNRQNCFCRYFYNFLKSRDDVLPLVELLQNRRGTAMVPRRKFCDKRDPCFSRCNHIFCVKPPRIFVFPEHTWNQPRIWSISGAFGEELVSGILVFSFTIGLY